MKVYSMCGICGYIQNEPASDDILQKMNHQLHHRGPDQDGYYISDNVALAMRRLSVIDLSTGKQPISNEDETIWIVFNGEIYNFQGIRNELEKRGHHFKTSSDTEVIVHAYEEYGNDCVQHFNGMFTFAIWDSNKRSLFIARDRIGIKPVYYAVQDGEIFFGSELKSVIQHPSVSREIDFIGLDHFLTLEYIPAPHTILQSVKKLPAGHSLTFSDGQIEIQQYWNIKQQDLPTQEAEQLEMLEELIRSAVSMRLISDVPLGSFLSGGIDSSTIVSFMSELTNVPVQTFSIGFGDPTYNELPYARLVAQSNNTQHTEEFLEPNIADLAEQLIRHLDEPLGDFSIIPTYLVSSIARQSVTVALSGDGGDELFGGYDTYIAQRMARYYDWMPSVARKTIFPMIASQIPPSPQKKGVVNKAKRFIEGGQLPSELQHTRWMMFLTDNEKNKLYSDHFKQQLSNQTPITTLSNHFNDASGWDKLKQQQYVDIKTYLVDNILTKVDRMSMKTSLECRVPLLDHRIVEFAMSLPTDMKIHNGTTKYILRKVIEKRVPNEILNKPKEGFSIPIKHWLKDTLNPMMNDLLNPEMIKRQRFFNSDYVTQCIDEHMTNRANHSHRLWAMMVFQLWYKNTIEEQ